MTHQRILLVEDEPAIAIDEQQILECLGHTVTGTVSTGEDAVRRTGEDNPDLVLMDITLDGDMDGIDAACKIHDLFGAPVVFVTAHGDMTFLDRAKESEPFGYVLKPFTNETLAAAIEVAVYKNKIEGKLKKSEKALHLTVLELQGANGRLKTMAEELAIARDAAIQANLAKSAFLAAMSHELRTPLNAIIGFSGMMGERIFGSLGDPHYGEYANDINKSGNHLLLLINDVLDLSKVEAGKLELHDEEVDIGEAVQSSLDLMHQLATSGKVELVNELNTNLIALRADERMIRQILLNLLSNAVKFTPEGGRVTVCTALGDNGSFILTVKDTGIGIAEKDIARVLSPYAQVDSTLSRKHDGTGLGVPLVNKMVEMHGGTLMIKSKVGEGTVMTLSFPLERIIAKRGETPCRKQS